MFKLIMSMNNSTSPRNVSTKIKSTNIVRMDHQYVMCLCNTSRPRCDGSCPIQKTFCWKSTQGVGCHVAPSQIVHFQGTNVCPMYHCVKQHPPPHPSSLLER